MIISIVGTRPQFLKLSPLAKQLNQHNIVHKIIHTGQHYDNEMSQNIFDKLNICAPDYCLKRKGNTNIESLCNMMINIEKILLDEKPDKIIVFGDCDTTIAGSIVAKKLKIYLIHIEAGMRSYNKDMPEEMNRILTDHMSDLLLCSTKDSQEKLKKENIINNVYFVGNLQLELLEECCLNYNNEEILLKNKIEKNNFILLTIHREYNTNELMLKKIFSELDTMKIDIIFPIHPRTKNVIETYNIIIPSNIKVIKPVDYLNMTILERYCKIIITDSGGIQPEAWYLNKKCIIMRSETEWIEPIKTGNNILYDYNVNLNDFVNKFINVKQKKFNVDICVSKNILKYLL